MQAALCQHSSTELHNREVASSHCVDAWGYSGGVWGYSGDVLEIIYGNSSGGVWVILFVKYDRNHSFIIVCICE